MHRVRPASSEQNNDTDDPPALAQNTTSTCHMDISNINSTVSHMGPNNEQYLRLNLEQCAVAQPFTHSENMPTRKESSPQFGLVTMDSRATEEVTTSTRIAPDISTEMVDRDPHSKEQKEHSTKTTQKLHSTSTTNLMQPNIARPRTLCYV